MTTPNSGLGAILENHAKSETTARQKLLSEKLSHLLAYLEEAFIKEPELRKLRHTHRPFVWPAERDFLELDECIFGLAASLRKGPVTFFKAIDLVDQRWSRFRLGKRIEGLFKRAVGILQDDQPPVSRAAKHYHRVKELSDGKSKAAASSKAFWADHVALRRGAKNLSEVKWDNHYDALIEQGQSTLMLQSSLPFKQGSPQECCSKYLELEREYWLWNEEFKEWTEKQALAEPFFAWFERNDENDEALSPDAVRLRKLKDDARRQRKSRNRKRFARIPVTLDQQDSLADLKI